ncbi:hypothetical protein CEXT_623421 [Caerostris extrusa]|uniref:Uncharacterized protein n=1 Tax=Caerostris extrusa TaxID=172846 RepID=A0AAV4NX92_CAEEX|nr:hypothetical protein CEXT_623421 [Caerostris extrusa]
MDRDKAETKLWTDLYLSCLPSGGLESIIKDESFSVLRGMNFRWLMQGEGRGHMCTCTLYVIHHGTEHQTDFVLQEKKGDLYPPQSTNKAVLHGLSRWFSKGALLPLGVSGRITEDNGPPSNALGRSFNEIMEMTRDCIYCSFPSLDLHSTENCPPKSTLTLLSTLPPIKERPKLLLNEVAHPSIPVPVTRQGYVILKNKYKKGKGTPSTLSPNFSKGTPPPHPPKRQTLRRATHAPRCTMVLIGQTGVARVPYKFEGAMPFSLPKVSDFRRSHHPSPADDFSLERKGFESILSNFKKSKSFLTKDFSIVQFFK